jgi:hypothetical protein
LELGSVQAQVCEHSTLQACGYPFEINRRDE